MARFTGHQSNEWHELTALLEPWPLDDSIVHTPRFEIGERADCCSAPAAFLVVLAPPASSSRRAHLLLCGHHRHAHQQALRTAGASVYDQDGVLVA